MIWAKPVFALAILVIGGIYAPIILPILSVPAFLSYEHKLGIEQQKFENQPQGVLPQIYADMFGWEQIAQRVAAYYHTLSPEEQRKTAIFANTPAKASSFWARAANAICKPSALATRSSATQKTRSLALTSGSQSITAAVSSGTCKRSGLS